MQEHRAALTTAVVGLLHALPDLVRTAVDDGARIDGLSVL